MAHRPTLTPTRLLLCTLALSGTLLVGCSDDSSNNNGGGGKASTDYVGLLSSDNGLTGPLNLTFASPVVAPPMPGTGPSFSSAAVNVTGTLQLGGGGLIDITGVLSDDDVLTMSGGGYDLIGELDNGIIVGGFTNAGIVLITGAFVAASSSDGSPALAFCGTFAGQDFDDPPTENSGTFSLVVANGFATGVAVDDEGNAIPIQGTATSSSISINQNDPDSGGTLNASGTYNSTSMSGTFNVSVSGVPLSTGTFSGGICGQET